MNFSFSFTSPFLLTAALVAQVPVGSAINGSIAASATPLIVVSRTPTVTNITGAFASNINALRIDPIDGRIWLAGNESPDLRRGSVNFAGGTFVNDTLIATLPVTNPAAIAFDIDCNPVVAGGSLTGAGGVYSVHRNTGTVTALVTSASGLTGTPNAIDEDATTGDLYFGVFGTGNVYKISPPYTLNSQVLVGTIPSVTELSGLSFARPASAPGGLIYLTSFAGTVNASLSTMTTSGVATPVNGVPAWVDLNWVDYDSVRGDLWLATTFGARSLLSSTSAGANALVHQIPSGVPACVEVNDVDTTIADLRVCPLRVPVPTAAVQLELAVAGNPGEVGVIAILSPTLVVLGLGPVAADGRFSVAFPGINVPAGGPGAIRFLAATVDTTLLTLKLSQTVAWPLN